MTINKSSKKIVEVNELFIIFSVHKGREKVITTSKGPLIFSSKKKLEINKESFSNLALSMGEKMIVKKFIKSEIIELIDFSH